MLLATLLTTHYALHVLALILLTAHYGLLVCRCNVAHGSLYFLGLLQHGSSLIVGSFDPVHSCLLLIKHCTNSRMVAIIWGTAHYMLLSFATVSPTAHYVLLMSAIIWITVHYMLLIFQALLMLVIALLATHHMLCKCCLYLW